MARKRNKEKRLRPGQPSKLADPTVRERFIKVLGLGLPISVACNAAGIDESTFYHWQKGNIPNDVAPEVATEFFELASRAKDIGVAALSMQLADNPDWRAKSWLLERRRPDLFAKAERVELSGPDGGPIQSERVDLAEFGDDVIELLAQAVDALNSGDDDDDD